MSADTDAALESFRARIDTATTDLAGDLQKLLDQVNSPQGATIAEINAALTPVVEALEATAAKVS